MWGEKLTSTDAVLACATQPHAMAVSSPCGLYMSPSGLLMVPHALTLAHSGLLMVPHALTLAHSGLFIDHDGTCITVAPGSLLMAPHGLTVVPSGLLCASLWSLVVFLCPLVLVLYSWPHLVSGLPPWSTVALSGLTVVPSGLPMVPYGLL